MEKFESINVTLNNDSNLVDSDEKWRHHHPATIVTFCIIYGFISLTAFLGNLMVLWIIATVKRMNSVINLYIGNLALADVIIAVLYIPFQFQAALLYRWNLPAFMCKLCTFIQHLSINASVMTLVIIALDRYRGITWPLKGTYSKFKAKIIIGIVWCVGTIEAFPNLIIYHTVVRDGKQVCIHNYQTIGPDQINLYNLIMVMVQYVIPLLMILITYGSMCKTLRGVNTPGQAIDQRDAMITANKKKVNNMLIIVMGMFGFCWLPYQAFYVLTALKFRLNFTGINYVYMSFHILAMSNSMVNPFIYGIYNEKFRYEFHRKLSCLFPRLIKTSGQLEPTYHTNGGQVIRANSIQTHTRDLRKKQNFEMASIAIKSINNSPQDGIEIKRCNLPNGYQSMIQSQQSDGEKNHNVNVSTK